ncbi:NAD(P)-binding protein [Mycena chlorophos]|uniref:NAD(P)-binding protein n=1 Tax=Mycena chlorophos TaxID=658473 RepID=A0A8H6STE2_MYCCL|nr:NAD(P)-binding protein [Mycena chlorophos]
MDAAGYPIPGQTTVYDTSASIDLENAPLDGGFLAKTLILSIDPFLRGKMRKPEKKSYSAEFKIGEPLYSYGVARVLRSETPDVKVASTLLAILFVPFSEYAIYPPTVLPSLTVVDKRPDLELRTYVGAAGMPGQTAYSGWKEHADPKPVCVSFSFISGALKEILKQNDVVFVTTGAGPVGSFVIQLAKQAGCKVIASAGSEDKVAFMKSIGADVAFNYKTTDTREVLQKEGPIDIYWDHVGGEILDAVIEYSAENARLINLSMAVGKCLHLHGILVFRIFHKHAKAFWDEIPPKLASGEIKFREEVTKGLDKAGDVILAVQKGTNTGKAIVVVAEE